MCQDGPGTRIKPGMRHIQRFITLTGREIGGPESPADVMLVCISDDGSEESISIEKFGRSLLCAARFSDVCRAKSEMIFCSSVQFISLVERHFESNVRNKLATDIKVLYFLRGLISSDSRRKKHDSNIAQGARQFEFQQGK